MRYTEAVWTTFITVLQTQSYSKIKCLPLCLSNLSTYLPICDAALVSFHRGGPPPLHSFFTGLSLFSHVLQRMWWPPLPQTKKILKVVVIQRVWAMALGRNNWKHQSGDSLPGDPILSDLLFLWEYSCFIMCFWSDSVIYIHLSPGVFLSSSCLGHHRSIK